MMIWQIALLTGVSARVFQEHVGRPAGWVEQKTAPDPNEEFNLLFALHSRVEMDELATMVAAVATPGSAHYKSYKSAAEVQAMMMPEGASRVAAWAASAGAVEVSGDWLELRTTVGQAEELLSTRLRWFRHKDEKKLHAVTGYTIPESLEDVVDFVAGLHCFFGGKPEAYKAKKSTTVTPTVLDGLYSLPTITNASYSVGSSQAVVQFGDNYKPDDLEQFFEEERASLSGQTIEMKYGTNSPSGIVQGEASLDTEYIMAMGQFVDTYDYFLTFGADPAGFLKWTYLVGNDTDAPLIHSISYGEYGGNYDNATVQRFSSELAKLGLRGISVTLASGDNGVGCSRTLKCSAGDISQVFDFPSSPYITMVGATELDDGTEVGATLSSGGFSSDYALGSFQADAVQAYFDKLDAGDVPMPSESFIRDGRAYPDVAAIGQDVKVIVSGRSELLSGTSCSSPMFAGIIALINAQLIANGQATLGWLQPFLYAHPDMFTDVTSGSNPDGCCDGFEASAGWDPVTGLGTPIYTKMLEYALADGAKNNNRLRGHGRAN